MMLRSQFPHTFTARYQCNAMSSPADAQTSKLIQRAAAGESSAREALLIRHEDRLKKMVAIRMDGRLRGAL